MRGESVPVIFGIKLKQHREKRGYTLKAFAERTGLSPSYLNEIEKGKKYPKTDKILQIAEGLDVPYDELVSLKLDQALNPLESILDSPIVRALPLDLFGLERQDLVNLITRSPRKIVALVRTLDDISRAYGVHVEHFYYAMLRSFQEAQGNYFEDIESAAAELRRAQGWVEEWKIDAAALRTLLDENYGVRVDDSALQEWPALAEFRSIYRPGPPQEVLLNPRLSPRQQAFQLAREVGYRAMALEARGLTSSRTTVESFEQVLNDFKASYFAGALLIGKRQLLQGMRALFASKTWDPAGFLALLARFDVTPEMFLYRMTQLMPHEMHLSAQHFVRMHHFPATDTVRITKQFNTSSLLLPAGLGAGEHHCRRWVGVSLLTGLPQNGARAPGAAPALMLQRAHFLNAGEEYLSLALARPLALTPGANSSITVGWRLDRALKQAVRFWNDPAIPSVEVNESCERCALAPEACDLRQAPPALLRQHEAHEEREAALQRLLQGAPAGSAA